VVLVAGAALLLTASSSAHSCACARGWSGWCAPSARRTGGRRRSRAKLVRGSGRGGPRRNAADRRGRRRAENL